MSELTDRIHAIETEIAALESQIALLQEEASVDQDEIAALTAQVASLTAALAACEEENPPPPPEPPALMISATADRANPQPLSSVGSLVGRVYIFAVSDEGPIQFLIDGTPMNTDQATPFDLGGGTATTSNGFDTKTLSDGGHVIEAERTDGSGDISVAVVVKNATTPPPPTGDDPFNPPWLADVGPRANAIPNVPASAIKCTTLAQVAAAPVGAMLEVSGAFNDATLPLKGGQKVWARQLKMVGADNAKLVVPQGIKGYTIYGGDFSGYHGLSRKGNTTDARRWAWFLDNASLVGSHVHHMRRGGVAMLRGSQITDNTFDHNPSFDFSGASECYCGYNDLGEGSGGGGVHPDGSNASDEGICKTAQAENMTYEYNYCHDVKEGNGLWSDINNRGHRWYRNLLEDIPGIGIDLEISCNGEILENVCRRVGKKSTQFPTWPTKSSIDVSNTPDAEVIGNAIEDTDIGFAAFNSNGHEGWRVERARNCCLGVRNLLVQRNHFRNIHMWALAITGSIPSESERHPAERCNQKEITDPASNNKFVDNEYPTTSKFLYAGKEVDRASWESHGYS